MFNIYYLVREIGDPVLLKHKYINMCVGNNFTEQSE